MKKNRAFSFTILGAEFFAAVQKIPFKDRGAFVTQLAADFITLEPITDYGKQVITETIEKISKQSEYGKLGGKPKHRHPKGTLKAPYEEPIDTLEAPLTQKNKNKEKEVVKRFVPPSLQEVETYITESGFNVDANKWFNHYTANGWRVGKTKMVDWKAAVRTWVNRSVDLKPQQAEIQRYN